MDYRRMGGVVEHTTRAMANEKINRAVRERQIIECLKGRELTAKEIAVMMCDKEYIPTSERNFTAPRLTEMADRGIVEAIGKRKCQYTGRTVAVYKLREV